MSNLLDNIIIGAGPAGIQLGFYLNKQNINYVILEQGATPGNFFNTFPVHNTLISINKAHTGYSDPNINLRWDWNSLLSDESELLFTKYTQEYFPHRKHLLAYLNDFARHFKLNILYNTKIVKIARNNDRTFCVKLADGQMLHAKRVIVATGVSKQYIPKIPGILHTTFYANLNSDKEPFLNKRVLIIGKGNSAFETANHLLDTASLIHVASPAPLKFACHTRHPGHLRSINMVFLDSYFLKSQNGIINADINKITVIDGKYHVEIAYKNAENEVETIVYDRVISCTGFEMDKSIFHQDCLPTLDLNNRFAKLSATYESCNIPDLFFIGTLMQQRDFKKKQSAFIHGFRYNIQFFARYLLARYYQYDLHCKNYPADEQIIAEIILDLVNRNSGLWQQSGELCSALVYNPQNHAFELYSLLPYAFAASHDFIRNRFALLISLEFGDLDKISLEQNFNLPRIHKDNYLHAAKSGAIHPVIRFLKGAECFATHHILEDFSGFWGRDVHTKPLNNFIKQSLKKIMVASSVKTS